MGAVGASKSFTSMFIDPEDIPHLSLAGGLNQALSLPRPKPSFNPLPGQLFVL